jgi:uncharacterized UBP type Zn finger protein
MGTTCTHLDQIRFTQVTKHYCEDCIKTGGAWVHLRMCLSCGHVGCCDSSPNKHASRHAQHTSHPLVRSAETGESWIWCYADELVAGEIGT